MSLSGGRWPVKLIYYDDQSSPPNVPAFYATLYKVDFVVSGYGTRVTAPALMAHHRLFRALFALAVRAAFALGDDPGRSLGEREAGFLLGVFPPRCALASWWKRIRISRGEVHAGVAYLLCDGGWL